ncbi:10319_t:CDS:1, partial [Racocetra persica]
HLELENDQYFPLELLSAIYSVDIEQLQGRYIDFTIRDHPSVSHIVFFFRNDVTITYKEYTKIPSHLRQDWIIHKSKNMTEYQTKVLKIKHPSIFTDQNFNDIL